MSTNSKESSQTNHLQVRTSNHASLPLNIRSSREEPMENPSNEETKITLNDINQLKIRVKSIGITFDEMNAIQVD